MSRSRSFRCRSAQSLTGRQAKTARTFSLSILVENLVDAVFSLLSTFSATQVHPRDGLIVLHPLLQLLASILQYTRTPSVQTHSISTNALSLVKTHLCATVCVTQQFSISGIKTTVLC